MSFLARVDQAIYRAEGWFITVSMVVMSAVVFVDVVWRTSAS